MNTTRKPSVTLEAPMEVVDAETGGVDWVDPEGGPVAHLGSKA